MHLKSPRADVPSQVQMDSGRTDTLIGSGWSLSPPLPLPLLSLTAGLYSWIDIFLMAANVFQLIQIYRLIAPCLLLLCNSMSKLLRLDFHWVRCLTLGPLPRPGRRDALIGCNWATCQSSELRAESRPSKPQELRVGKRYLPEEDLVSLPEEQLFAGRANKRCLPQLSWPIHSSFLYRLP